MQRMVGVGRAEPPDGYFRQVRRVGSLCGRADILQGLLTKVVIGIVARGLLRGRVLSAKEAPGEEQRHEDWCQALGARSAESYGDSPSAAEVASRSRSSRVTGAMMPPGISRSSRE